MIHWGRRLAGQASPALRSAAHGPQDVAIDRQNPDLLDGLSTDNGNRSNVKWPFSLSHNRVQDGGSARQQNGTYFAFTSHSPKTHSGLSVHSMPIATSMAGVNMRLKARGIRTLAYCVLPTKWAYVLAGQNYNANVYPGDLWIFRGGIPHAIQGLNDTAVFDDGEFSEDSTSSVTDWMAQVPKEVLGKNFKVNASAFDHIPDRQLRMLPSSPPPQDILKGLVVSPQGVSTLPYTFAASKSDYEQRTVKVVDSRTFNISKTIALAEVTVEVGGMRELHRHPTQPEWSYFIEGETRITVFAASANARTFNYQARVIGYVPPSFGHYVKSLGNTTIKFLEIFNSNIYEDISLNQWLALTPPDLVNLSDDTISELQKTKLIVVAPELGLGSFCRLSGCASTSHV
ncbi:Bicupin, oxalate decarboxylase/oxidase [Ceratobasidium sp. AG-I]|nr:Bicupin, oxalate decarboxylase/oxidase [Ceratobasidium sp. AG-I]